MGDDFLAFKRAAGTKQVESGRDTRCAEAAGFDHAGDSHESGGSDAGHVFQSVRHFFHPVSIGTGLENDHGVAASVIFNHSVVVLQVGEVHFGPCTGW